VTRRFADTRVGKLDRVTTRQVHSHGAEWQAQTRPNTDRPPTTMLLTGPLSPGQPQLPSEPAAGGTVDIDLCDPLDPPILDPPPPYPSPRHQRTPRAGTLPRSAINSARRVQYSPRLVYHQPHSSSDSQDRGNSPTPPAIHSDEDFVVEPTEHTQLLGPPLARRIVSAGARQRSYSHTSTLSAAPSLARTVFSLFQAEEDPPQDPYASDDDHEVRSYLVTQDQRQDGSGDVRRSRSPSSKGGFFSIASWGRYFRPLTKKVYYKALLHLMVINFPYTLVAWVYLFVFTVVSQVIQNRVSSYFSHVRPEQRFSWRCHSELSSASLIFWERELFLVESLRFNTIFISHFLIHHLLPRGPYSHDIASETLPLLNLNKE
jgi:hypothetical protein